MQSFRVFRIIEEFCQHRTENVEQGFGRHYLVMEYNQDALVVVRCGNERETAHPNTADHQFELLNKATSASRCALFCRSKIRSEPSPVSSIISSSSSSHAPSAEMP